MNILKIEKNNKISNEFLLNINLNYIFIAKNKYLHLFLLKKLF